MLKNDTVTLRAPEPEDLDILLKWENDARLWYLSNTMKPFSRHDIEQYILNAQLDIFTQKQVRFMIDVKNEKNTVTAGCIDLFDFDPAHSRAGIGILIDEDFRQQGIAQQALQLCTSYAKEILNLHQLWCSITSDNHASKKLFSAAGFVNCGTRKQWIRKHEQWLDEELYQLLF